MKKRKTAAQKLREELIRVSHEVGRLQGLLRDEKTLRLEKERPLNVIAQMLGRPNYRMHDRYEPVEHEQLPFEVMRLIDYKRNNEASLVPEKVHNEHLLQIIKWHIKPSAISEEVEHALKDLELYRQQYGPIPPPRNKN